MSLSLRDEQPADEPFLRRLILETVAAQLGAEAWPEPMRSSLLEIQYTSRLASVRARSDARSRIIGWDGIDCGWLVTAGVDGALRLVDIMIAADRRGCGAGSAAIGAVLEEAGARSVRLSVNAGNDGAIRLYERLGFRRVGGDELQQEMERPGGRS